MARSTSSGVVPRERRARAWAVRRTGFSRTPLSLPEGDRCVWVARYDTAGGRPHRDRNRQTVRASRSGVSARSARGGER